jgi:hypothetical protein
MFACLPDLKAGYSIQKKGDCDTAFIKARQYNVFAYIPGLALKSSVANV